MIVIIRKDLLRDQNLNGTGMGGMNEWMDG